MFARDRRTVGFSLDTAGLPLAVRRSAGAAAVVAENGFRMVRRRRPEAGEADVTDEDWRRKPDGFNGEPRLVTEVAPSLSAWRGYEGPGVAPGAADPGPIDRPEVGEVRWTGLRFLHPRWSGAAWEVVRYDPATRRLEAAVVIEPLVR